MTTSTLARATRTPLFHLLAAVGFVALNAVGYRYGGLQFVQDWGGGFAAVIATWYLVFKAQGYWLWMMVNAGLWTALFFHMGIPLLACLQISIVLFSAYGAVQWALVKWRIGFDLHVRSDLVGAVLGLGMFAVALVAYRNAENVGTGWWWVEFASVALAVAAIWMDAFRYRANWIAWSISNCFSAPLFFHTHLWGAFWTIFVYQAINVYGWIEWTRAERSLRQLVPAEVL
jgi:hypothetical protein